MRNFRQVTLLTLLAGAFAQPAWGEDLMSAELADAARGWQQKNRDDLAAELWRKLLRSDPTHGEALVKLGLIDARAGKVKQAEALLNRARQLKPAPRGVNELALAVQAAKNAPKAPKVEPAPPVAKPAAAPEAKLAAAETKTASAPEPKAASAPAPKAASVPEPKPASAPEPKAASAPDPKAASAPTSPPKPAAAPVAQAAPAPKPEAKAAQPKKSAPPKLAAKPKPKSKGAGLRVETALQPVPPAAAGDSGAAVVLAVKAPEAAPSPGPQQTQAKALALLKAAMADEMNAAYDAAAAKLEEAMVLDPVNPWVRLGLARQYQRLGVRGGASNLLDNLIETHPAMPEALYARALLYASEQMWWEALAAMERIAPSARSADMARDQRRMWVNVQVQRARQLQAQGHAQQASAALEAAQAAAGADDALLAAVAAGWSDIGEAGKGLRLMRELVSSGSLREVAARIKYAEILANAGQDAELSAVLRELAAPGRLNPAQQEQLNAIILGYTLRLAETLRESGRHLEAAEVIGPAAQRSDDPRLQAALARIYKASGDNASALAVIERAIVREPDELGHRLLASDLALALNVMDKAIGHAQAALDLAPDHPRALSVAGRVEKARGNLPAALQYFQRAYAMEQDRNAFAGVGGNLALRLLSDEPSPAGLASRPVPFERSGLLPIPDLGPRSERPPALRWQPETEPAAPQRPPPRPEPASPALSENKARILAKVADLLTSSDGSYALKMARINYLNGTAYPTAPAAAPAFAEEETQGIRLKLSVSLDMGQRIRSGRPL